MNGALDASGAKSLFSSFIGLLFQAVGVATTTLLSSFLLFYILCLLALTAPCLCHVLSCLSGAASSPGRLNALDSFLLLYKTYSHYIQDIQACIVIGCKLKLTEIRSHVGPSLPCLALPCLALPCPAMEMSDVDDWQSARGDDWESDAQSEEPTDVESVPELDDGWDSEDQAWESDVEGVASRGSDDDASDLENLEGPDVLFLEYMVELLLRRTLNAKQFCIVMWYVGECGVDIARQYGLKPGSKSGHYGRHVNKVLHADLDQKFLYPVRMPATTKSGQPCIHNTYFSAAWQDIDADNRLDPDIFERINEAIAEGSVPPNYDTHPAVTSKTSPVLPMDLFIDAVPYSIQDSVIGVWLVNLLNSKRYLVAALRKKRLCMCGCKGWCSFYVLFTYINYMLTILSNGEHPLLRHDSSEFEASEQSRIDLMGTCLVVAACICRIRGDWSEYASTWGLPTWGDALRPCFGCNASLWNLYSGRRLSLNSLPWRSNIEGEYDEACRRCELHVCISCAHHFDLSELLFYDKRKKGNHGLCLVDDYPPLLLRRGDRLEPCPTLPNVADFKHLTSFPVSLVFWRKSWETVARHNNPVFANQAAHGVSLNRCLSVDALHGLYLGELNAFNAHLLWFLILSGRYGRLGDQYEILQIALAALKLEMATWFKHRHEQFPLEKLTKPNDITTGMVGSADAQTLKLKGAENWCFLLFMYDTLINLRGHLGHDCERLIQAAHCLIEINRIFKTSPCRMSEAAIAESFRMYSDFLDITEEMEDLHIPKRHLLIHMFERIDHFGNPNGYATWYDEHLNRLLKASCRDVSQQTFDRSLLLRMRILLKLEHAKRLSSQ